MSDEPTALGNSQYVEQIDHPCTVCGWDTGSANIDAHTDCLTPIPQPAMTDDEKLERGIEIAEALLPPEPPQSEVEALVAKFREYAICPRPGTSDEFRRGVRYAYRMASSFLNVAITKDKLEQDK